MEVIRDEQIKIIKGYAEETCGVEKYPWAAKEIAASLLIALDALSHSCICGEFGYINKNCPACTAVFAIEEKMDEVKPV